MEQNTTQLMLSLIRSAMSGEALTADERALCTDEEIARAIELSTAHDLGQLVAWGLKKNGIPSAAGEKHIFTSVYRHQQIKYEYEKLCKTFEEAGIQFLPLKGAVMRSYYAEPWMRTSCDIDILVRKSELDKVGNMLVEQLKYRLDIAHSHDVAYYSPTGVHVEIHFDLIEESVMNASAGVLKSVWEVSTVKEGFRYLYEMPDDLFYFYHVAHMAKHLLNGGCGIKPFIDLWILDNIAGADRKSRKELLEKGELKKFTESAQRLSRVWFGDGEHDDVSLKLEGYVLAGGVYGAEGDNRLSVQMDKLGGRSKHMLSMIFLPYDSIKYVYPILQRHRFLTPVMQVRRWLRLIFKGRILRATRMLADDCSVSEERVTEVHSFLGSVGLL